MTLALVSNRSLLIPRSEDRIARTIKRLRTASFAQDPLMSVSESFKPWRAEWCGDCYRIFDASDRHLFVIGSDEFLNEKEDPADATAFLYGTSDEQTALDEEILQLFPGEASDD